MLPLYEHKKYFFDDVFRNAIVFGYNAGVYYRSSEIHYLFTLVNIHDHKNLNNLLWLDDVELKNEAINYIYDDVEDHTAITVAFKRGFEAGMDVTIFKFNDILEKRAKAMSILRTKFYEEFRENQPPRQLSLPPRQLSFLPEDQYPIDNLPRPRGLDEVEDDGI